MPQTDRRVYADVIRISATLAVIVLHMAAGVFYASPVGSFPWQTLNFYDSLVRVAVPLFVMLSGSLMLSPARNVSISRLFTKNMPRLLAALLFWGLAYEAYPILKAVFAEGIYDVPGVFSAFRRVLSGDVHFHLYYLFIILGLYLVTPVLRVFTANAGRRMAQYFLVVSFSATAVSFFSELLPDLPVLSLLADIRVGVVTGFVFYYMLGYYIDRYGLTRIVRYVLYCMGILGFAFTFFATGIVSILTGELVTDFYNGLTPNVMLSSAAAFVFIKNRCARREPSPRTAAALARVSNLCFGVYLVHDFFIMLLRECGLTPLSFPPIFSVPVLSLAVCLAAFAVSWALSKIPFVNRYLV